MIIGYLSFGRVPGCLGLGALFLWDEWREGRTDRLPAGRLHGRAWCGRFAGSPSCALERHKKDALQRNSGIVLSLSCALERNKESNKVVINGLI